MKETALQGFDPFVIPFAAGLAFILVYCIAGLAETVRELPSEDRKKLGKSLLSPRILAADIRDIFRDCLLHAGIFRKNALLGYMHMSIAFGWFLLIVAGHAETAAITPEMAAYPWYPIFFRFFVPETYAPAGSAGIFHFIMDLLLLFVLSGITLAALKRIRKIRSAAMGMKRASRTRKSDKAAMYALWAIFPLRLLAESSVYGFSGGGFLTEAFHFLLFRNISGGTLPYILWWAYSISLGTFFVMLPWSRYMHIPAEAALIVFRNAGIKAREHGRGFARLEAYSCSFCGICIDVCPMTAEERNARYTSAYFVRALRNGETEADGMADICLQCGRCVEACPVGIGSCDLKQLCREKDRKIRSSENRYGYLAGYGNDRQAGIVYYGGCMTQLTPSVSRSVAYLLDKAGAEWTMLDPDGGICCGRPALLAGDREAAERLIAKNTEAIRNTGAGTLVLSCPICLRMFRENYRLEGIEILHHTQMIERLVSEGRLEIPATDTVYTYHDPCELGRGCGIYEEPRSLIRRMGTLSEAPENRSASVCCGASLGSVTMDRESRKAIAGKASANLEAAEADTILTACPLCLRTLASASRKPVKDIALAAAESIRNKEKRHN